MGLDDVIMRIKEIIEAPSLKAFLVFGTSVAYNAVGGVGGAYLSLMFLIVADTILGVYTADKLSWAEWKKFPGKIILYWTAIACTLHLDIGLRDAIPSWIDTAYIPYAHKGMILWFCSTEFLSICRKLNKMGLNIPIKHIKQMLVRLFRRFSNSVGGEEKPSKIPMRKETQLPLPMSKDWRD